MQVIQISIKNDYNKLFPNFKGTKAVTQIAKQQTEDVFIKNIGNITKSTEKIMIKGVKDIYNELSEIIGSNLESVPQLHPDIITKESPSHFIEPSGRARAYFPFDVNMKVQEGLIQESLDWNRLAQEEKIDFLKNNSLKCIDINGSVYTTRPAMNTFCINSPIELIALTKIKLNFIRNNLETEKIFSDIELE